MRCSAAQLWLGGQGPAQPSPAVLSWSQSFVTLSHSRVLSRPLSSRYGLVRSGQFSPVSQSDSQSVAVLVAQSSIHSFAQSQSNRSSAWQEGARTFAHLDCHTAPVRHFSTLLACTFLSNLPTPCLPAAPCTLHLATHPTSFLPFAVCWLCVDVINVRVRVCLRERGVELISKFHIRTHPYPYHSRQYPAPAPPAHAFLTIASGSTHTHTHNSQHSFHFTRTI